LGNEFDPIEFLHFAGELVKEKFSYHDAKIRTILNRCYYAVYLTCAFELLGLEPENPNFKHDEVYRKVKGKGELGRQIAKELDYLWIYRKAADYYPVVPYKIRGRGREKLVLCSDQEAEDAINRAKRALEKLRNLST